LKKIGIIIMVFFIILSSTFVFAEGDKDNIYLTGESFVIEGEDFIDGSMKFEFNLIKAKIEQDAYNFLLDNNGEYLANRRLNEAKEKKKDVLLVKFKVSVIEIERETIDLNAARLFEAMDYEGEIYRRHSATDTDNPFRSIEVQQGDEISGWVTFLISKEDLQFVLVSLGNETAYIVPEFIEYEKVQSVEEKEDDDFDEVEEEDIDVEEEEDEGDPISAYIMSEMVVKDNLKAPSTAEFPGYGKSEVQKLDYLDDDIYIVRSYVDAENAFGAMVRTKYKIELEYTGDYGWKVLDLKFY